MNIEPFKVICIDDTKIPTEIPKDLRVVNGEVYHVDGVENLLSSKVIGFTIVEKPLGEECFPYHYWGTHRFAEYTPEMEAMEAELEEMLKPDKIYVA